MAGDDDAGRAPERPDAAGVAARSMTQLAQQMREMADRMLTGGLPGWPMVGAPPSGVQRSGPSDAGEPGAGSSGSGASGAAGSGTAQSGRRPESGPGVPGLPAIPGMPPIPGMPATPVTMSARQVQAIVDDIAARRSQVRALVAQLEAFDEQLGTLEASLRPLLVWLRTWADLEGAVTDFWTPRPPRS
jgi:hypothetical protein